MVDTIQMRQTRADKWEKAKAFLDSKRGADGVVPDEDVKAYEKMEAEVLALGKDIELMDRRHALDRELGGNLIRGLLGRPHGTAWRESAGLR